MAASLAKRDLYKIFQQKRRLREEAGVSVGDLSLSELSSPSSALKKINGHAVHHPTPSEVPAMEKHQAIESLTGFGDFDPFEAAVDRVEAERQRKALLEIKAAQIAARMNTAITVGEASAFRTLCVYRIVRELARIKTCISAGETLSEMTFWDSPPHAAVVADPDPLFRARKRVIEPILDMIVQFEDHLGEPIPFEPPEGEEEAKYFCYVVEEIAKSLYLERGSTKMPDYGILGTQGLFDWRTAPLVWPSRHELISTEELIIEEIVKKFCKSGDMAARAQIISKYGLLQHEALEMMHGAFTYTKNMVVADPEILRTKTILQLQHAVDECLQVGFNEEMIKALREMRDKTFEAPLPPQRVLDARVVAVADD